MFVVNMSSSNNDRFSVERTYQLETHWRSPATIRIERSREMFLSQFFGIVKYKMGVTNYD